MKKTIVGVFPNEACRDSSNHGFVKFRNPRSGADGVFLWNKSKKLIYEIQLFSNNRRSWIVNEAVMPDSGFYVHTPIDPLFLVLPYLRDHRHHFTSIDVVTHSDEYPLFSGICAELFGPGGGATRLESVADVKAVGESLLVYRYSDEKVLAWLSRKADRVFAHLVRSRDASGGGDGDGGDAPETLPASLQAELQATATNLVCDYLGTELERAFKDSRGLEDTLSEAHTLVTSPKAAKRRPPYDDAENLAEPRAAGRGRGAPRRRAGAEQPRPGQRSILSFFAKAP